MDLLASLLIHENTSLVPAASVEERTKTSNRELGAYRAARYVHTKDITSRSLIPDTIHHHPPITSTTMDIDSDMPPPSGQEDTLLMESEKDSLTIYSIAEFDRKWDQLHPPRFPLGTTNRASDTVVALPPVPVTGEAAAKANHLCQVHSFTPIYTYEEIKQGCFTSKLTFGPHACEAEGPLPSKKQAKDAAAVKALSVLETLEAPRKEKRKVSDRLSTEDDVGPGLKDENWVGQLVEFAHARSSTPPRFQCFETCSRLQQMAGLTLNPKTYAFTVHMADFPSMVFGSESSFYNSKADAKRAAARDAVLWLRANEHLPRLRGTPPSKRRTSTTDGGHTGLTQTISKLNTNQSSAQLVAERSIQLGFTQPQFEMRPCQPPAGNPVGQNFYTASARYVDQDVQREPRLQGALCETSAVYGQKGAKEMCCRDLLGLLECILREREEEMQKIAGDDADQLPFLTAVRETGRTARKDLLPPANPGYNDHWRADIGGVSQCHGMHGHRGPTITLNTMLNGSVSLLQVATAPAKLVVAAKSPPRPRGADPSRARCDPSTTVYSRYGLDLLPPRSTEFLKKDLSTADRPMAGGLRWGRPGKTLTEVYSTVE
ncbi:hypothetical protein Q7P37_004124 [Cladosporium fusiforme]